MIDKLVKILVKLNLSSVYSKAEEVKIKKIKLPILREQHDQPLTIVHISDLHIGFNYSYSDLIYHISLVNELNADFVMITGDLFDRVDKFKGNPYAYVPLLKTIRAAQGVFFCFGNHDQRTYETHIIQDILERSNIRILNNFGTTVYYDDEPIYLCGLDDILNSKGNITQALRNRQHPSHLTITMVHEPDFADYVKKFNVDLQLSGHSHGGQIRLPLLGAPITPYLGSKYVRGLYRLHYKTHELFVHVSPGLGVTHLPIRLFCPPEITVIELKH